MDYDRTHEVLAALEREGVRYVIFGGVALNLQGLARATQDLDVRLGEAYRFEDLDSERVEFGGLEVTVVTPETLYRMKRATVRPQDWGDAERLRQRFGFEDE